MKQCLALVMGVFLTIATATLSVAQGSGEPSGFDGQFPAVSGKGVLTITGGDYWYRQMYEDGEVPYLSAYELPDGIYRYQFRSIPANGKSSLRQKSVLMGEEQGSPRGRSGAATVISGTLEIIGGQASYR